METIAGVAGADGVAVAGRVKGSGWRHNIVEGVARQFSVIRRLQMKTLRAGGAARECRVSLALTP